MKGRHIGGIGAYGKNADWLRFSLKSRLYGRLPYHRRGTPWLMRLDNITAGPLVLSAAMRRQRVTPP